MPLLDAVAVRPDEGGLVLFAVNRSQTEPMALDVDLRALSEVSAAEHTCLADQDPDAINSMDAAGPGGAAAPGRPEAGRRPPAGGLPPLSWNMIRIS